MDVEKISNSGIKPKKVCCAVQFIVGCGDGTVPDETGLTLRLQKEDIQEVHRNESVLPLRKTV